MNDDTFKDHMVRLDDDSTSGGISAHSGVITNKALLKRQRFVKAARLTHPRVVRGWYDVDRGQSLRVETSDESLMRKLDIGTRKVWRAKTKKRPGFEQEQMVIPPHKFVRNGGPLFVAARSVVDLSGATPWWWDASGSPDEVVETVLPDGRVVYLHSFLARLVQRMWLLTVEPQVEPYLHPGNHGYRPGRSRFTAFGQFRAAVKKLPWVITKDIRRYYESVSLDLVEEVMKRFCPWIAPALRNLGLWFHMANIYRRPTHPERRSGMKTMWSQSLRHLLTGSIVAPFQSNLVGDFLVGWPLTLAMGDDIEFIRVADDMMVMAASPEKAMQAVEFIEQRLRAASPDLALHPNKGLEEPVDVRRVPVRWLGKVAHGSSVRTPDEKVADYIDELLATDTSDVVTFRRLVLNVKAELVLDGEKRVDFVVRSLRRASRRHADAFEQVGRPKSPQDHLSEVFEDYEAASAAKEEEP